MTDTSKDYSEIIEFFEGIDITNLEESKLLSLFQLANFTPEEFDKVKQATGLSLNKIYNLFKFYVYDEVELNKKWDYKTTILNICDNVIEGRGTILDNGEYSPISKPDEGDNDDNKDIDIPTEVGNEVNKDEERLSELKRLKSMLRPYMSKQYLETLLDNMVKTDSDYIRKYMVANSNILFQRDFIVKKKQNDIYNFVFLKTPQFNNDSTRIDFVDDKVLIRFSDFRLANKNNDYKIDIFVDVQIVERNRYYVRYSDSEYNFNTGGIRVFMDMDLFDNDDKSEQIVSIVAKRTNKLNKFYKFLRVTSFNENNYERRFSFNKDDIGDYDDNFNNLVCFKRSSYLQGSFSLLDRSLYSFAEDNDNSKSGYIIFQTTEKSLDIKINSEYLILNKRNICELDYTTDTEYTPDEYFKSATITKELVIDENVIDPFSKNPVNLPFPVENANELAVFVNGYKLIPDVDYTLVNGTDTTQQKIRYAGIIKPNSKISIRSLNIDDHYGFYGYDKTLKTTSDDSHISYGCVPLNNVMIPIDEYYVEAYLGRRRVPLYNKRSIANTILKIDNQKTISNLDYYSEINFDNITRNLLSYYNESKPTLTRISDTFRDITIDKWLSTNDKKENYYSNEDVTEDIFMGVIQNIHLTVIPEVLTQGSTPEYEVLGEVGVTGSDTTYLIDITDDCEISLVNTAILGEHEVIAEYKVSATGNILKDSQIIKIIEAEPTTLKLITKTNFVLPGDIIKDNLNAVLVYQNDQTTRDITSDSNLKLQLMNDDGTYSELPERVPEKSDFKTLKIYAEVKVGDKVFTATHTLVVGSTKDRTVMKFYITYTKGLKAVEIKNDNGEVTIEDQLRYELSIFAKYNNNYIQEIDPDKCFVYVNERTDDTLIKDIKSCSFDKYISNNTVSLLIDAFFDTDKKNKIEYNDKDETIGNVILNLYNGTSESVNSKNIVLYDIAQMKLADTFIDTLKDTNVDKDDPDEWKTWTWSVKDTSNSIYLTTGSYPLLDENGDPQVAISGADLSKYKNCIVEFYDASGYVVLNMIAILKDENSEEKDILNSASLSGCGYDGFTAKVNKFDVITSAYNELDTNDIYIRDKNNNDNIVCKFIDIDNGGYDSVTEEGNYYYFNFHNFDTNEIPMGLDNNYTPSIKAIQDYLIANQKNLDDMKLYIKFGTHRVYLDLGDKLKKTTFIKIGLRMNDDKITQSNAYFDFTDIFNCKLVLENNYTQDNGDITKTVLISQVLSCHPLNKNGSAEELNRLTFNDCITLPCRQSDKELLNIGTTDIGIHRYYFVSGGVDNKVYITDIDIELSENYGKHYYVKKINDTIIKETDYFEGGIRTKLK